jgi:large subunit ribosomal protein L9
MIEVFLLKSHNGVGRAGEIVKVKKGYATNFLVPQKIAAFATSDVVKKIQDKSQELKEKEKINYEIIRKLSNEIQNKKIIIIKNCSDDGVLYGSVISKDIYSQIEKISPNFATFITKHSINLSYTIKSIGKHKIKISPDYDLSFSLEIIVARSEDEAKSIISAEKDLTQKTA